MLLMLSGLVWQSLRSYFSSPKPSFKKSVSKICTLRLIRLERRAVQGFWLKNITLHTFYDPGLGTGLNFQSRGFGIFIF